MVTTDRQRHELRMLEQELKTHEVQLSRYTELNDTFEMAHHLHMVEYTSRKILKLEELIYS